MYNRLWYCHWATLCPSVWLCLIAVRYGSQPKDQCLPGPHLDCLFSILSTWSRVHGTRGASSGCLNRPGMAWNRCQVRVSTQRPMFAWTPPWLFVFNTIDFVPSAWYMGGIFRVSKSAWNGLKSHYLMKQKRFWTKLQSVASFELNFALKSTFYMMMISISYKKLTFSSLPPDHNSNSTKKHK